MTEQRKMPPNDALPARIRDMSDIERGLDALCEADPRLVRIRRRVEASGGVPLRLDRPGFAPLVEVVVTQQISRTSAAAIHGRLREHVDPLMPRGLLAMSDRAARIVGLSRPKVRTLRALAAAVEDGTLDPVACCDLTASEATAAITSVHGLGPWTASVYLLFCGGHPDIFPTRDIALQWSAADMAGMDGPVDARELDRVALERWSPWRSVAARLLWANYAVIRGREVLP